MRRHSIQWIFSHAHTTIVTRLRCAACPLGSRDRIAHSWKPIPWALCKLWFWDPYDSHLNSTCQNWILIYIFSNEFGSTHQIDMSSHFEREPCKKTWLKFGVHFCRYQIRVPDDVLRRHEGHAVDLLHLARPALQVRDEDLREDPLRLLLRPIFR